MNGAWVRRISFNLQAGDHRLPQGKVWGVLQELQHLAGVLTFIGLGPKGPYRRSAAGIEDALLQGRGVCQATDHATEGVHLMHQLALRRPAYGRVAGLPGDTVDVEGEESC